MRAILDANAANGAGYGIIVINWPGMLENPEFIIQRLSDGLTLSTDGWRKGDNSLRPDNFKYENSSLYLYVGPNVIDNISPDEKYTISLVGIDSCPLLIGSADHSMILTANDVNLARDTENAIQNMPLDETPNYTQTIYEGVESTPVNLANDEIEAAPTGVTAAPDSAHAQPEKKRKGCFLIASILLVIWIGGAWLLWTGSMNSPASEETVSAPFEIIPRATDSAVVEDDDGIHTSKKQ